MSDTIPPMRRRADLEKIALVTCRSELEKVKAINVELLAALRDLVTNSECSADGADIWDSARAAIAKAEGRS